MANQEYLDILKQGVQVWNQWRKEHPEIQLDFSEANLRQTYLRIANLAEVDLAGADLTGADLSEADLGRANLLGAKLSGANLYRATLSGANLGLTNLSKANLTETNLTGADLCRAFLYKASLSRANLSGADLNRAIFREADLSKANLSGANFSKANLSEANLSGANLSSADLCGADLSRTLFISTNLINATLKDCKIFGISVWDAQLDGAEQFNLTITPNGKPTITVDNLKIAQFIYLLLNNAEIRDVINTFTTKAVLILGRFTPERKAILDAIRDELRNQNYLPLLFDFDQPISRDITETVTTLARLARFIIADLTDAKSIPQELAFIVPDLPSVPIKPLLLRSQHEYGMFEHFTKYPWVLPIHHYPDLPGLLTSLKEEIIEPAEMKAKEYEKH